MAKEQELGFDPEAEKAANQKNDQTIAALQQRLAEMKAEKEAAAAAKKK